MQTGWGCRKQDWSLKVLQEELAGDHLNLQERVNLYGLLPQPNRLPLLNL
jgi:hypothetical protein